jgi:hypothetical protein
MQTLLARVCPYISDELINFYTIDNRSQLKHFPSSLMAGQNKLECLSLESLAIECKVTKLHKKEGP